MPLILQIITLIFALGAFILGVIANTRLDTVNNLFDLNLDILNYVLARLGIKV